MVSRTEPILELRGVNKSFGVVHVLHDVDFQVYPGEVTALVGDNGAGKSTLVKAIAGIHPVDTGTYLFQGSPVTVHGPNDVSALGVEVVYQDLALCDNLDIVENMFLGRELKHRGMLDEARMETMARDALKSLSVRTVKSVRQTVSSLSGGQRQTVAIAKSVLWNSKVVLLDEPTAALAASIAASVASPTASSARNQNSSFSSCTMLTMFSAYLSPAPAIPEMTSQLAMDVVSMAEFAVSS